jgi:hypothetical protein
LPLVQPHAGRAGFSLTVTTMVGKARSGLIDSGAIGPDGKRAPG